MNINTYGSRQWIESQYAAAKDDPWGLDWRPSQRYRYVRMLEALNDALCARQEPLAVIDVGCATGAFTAMLDGLNGRRDHALLGVDIAEQAVKRAAARFPQIAFRCMALSECANAYQGQADVVTCMEVLYYLPEKERVAAVRQLKNMLKPGGLLLVSSMVAPAPYFSFDRLLALLSAEMEIASSDILYLKPLVMLEKLFMRLSTPAARKWLKFDASGAQRWNQIGERMLGTAAQSHAFVIARNL
ncbi:MAG TPA: class I SAM-dependent methyltransferase [Burkholderiaceae bacterium]|nr:class I SAM-dependent methyltransferase [Burkholderiaceae bacterium]